MRRLLIAVVIGALALPVAGCGRKGSPEEPENAVYPRAYPYTPMPSRPRTDATSGERADAPPRASRPSSTESSGQTQ